VAEDAEPVADIVGGEETVVVEIPGAVIDIFQVVYVAVGVDEDGRLSEKLIGRGSAGVVIVIEFHDTVIGAVSDEYMIEVRIEITRTAGNRDSRWRPEFSCPIAEMPQVSLAFDASIPAKIAYPKPADFRSEVFYKQVYLG